MKVRLRSQIIMGRLRRSLYWMIGSVVWESVTKGRALTVGRITVYLSFGAIFLVN